MKQFIFLLTFSFLMTSCIVIKVYETPTKEGEEPKLIRKKSNLLPSGMTFPSPNEKTEILFFGDDQIPEPMEIHDDHLIITTDSISSGKNVIVRIDADDASSMAWTAKSSKAPKMLFIAKDSLLWKGDISEMDSLVLSPVQGKMTKRIRVMKTAKEDEKGENVFVFKSKSSDSSPLLVIDGEIKDKSVMESIDPDSIERIDVLKGEAAIKKYGEKGSNGVIQITMKKK